VLRDDESFSFAYLAYDADYARFCEHAAPSLQAACTRTAPFDPRRDESAVLHFTTLPWLHFSSFSHARNWGCEDSVPKLAFGRTDADGAHLWMPFAVEVHHALMDGLHLGRYVQAMEAALRQPQAWLA
jgi:chloramphenicol O-acetyltransferase type A